MTNANILVANDYLADECSTGVRRAITLAPTSRGKIVGNSVSMRDALDMIRRVASSMCTVLVTGESGTGKELLVAALHDASPRAHEAFVAVNCGAIPENLIESELFGHARGAFTGAVATRRGHVASAEGGTLFLDEIGELPLAMQVKLLRLLQQREYTPVGESRTVHCDVRVVAATNRDLEAEVAAGRFREDLYYRLNVINVHIPSLRDRPEDIADLASHFLKQAAARCGKTIEGFTDEAIQALEACEWPGNIRSLENAIERAVLFANGGLIELADLPARIRGSSEGPNVKKVVSGVVEVQRHCAPPPPMGEMDVATDPLPPPMVEPAKLPRDGIDLRSAVAAYESELIGQALERTYWNKQRAADLLNMNRTTLVEMIKRKGIVPSAECLKKTGSRPI